MSNEGMERLAPNKKGRKRRKHKLETKKLGGYSKLQSLFTKYNEQFD